jgi:hypothetical protein
MKMMNGMMKMNGDLDDGNEILNQMDMNVVMYPKLLEINGKTVRNKTEQRKKVMVKKMDH